MACLLKGGGGLYNRLSLGAVVLAAGQGSRLGHRPKSLIELAGIPLIRRQLIALSGAGVDQLVVVLGHYATQRWFSESCGCWVNPQIADYLTILLNPHV